MSTNCLSFGCETCPKISACRLTSSPWSKYTISFSLALLFLLMNAENANALTRLRPLATRQLQFQAPSTFLSFKPGQKIQSTRTTHKNVKGFISRQVQQCRDRDSSNISGIRNERNIFQRITNKYWKKSIAGILLSVFSCFTILVGKPSMALATEAVETGMTTTGALVMRPVSIGVEIQLSLRLLYAALIGAMLGKERSLAKHSAGVRTMALVAMGSSLYTICSAFGFLHMGRYDPSRMAANVASGVGFVGAGVITTSVHQPSNQTRGSHMTNVVHGLTTAATIWLSAAVGVSCGVGLYFVATMAAITTITILRLGRITPSRRPKQESKVQSSEVTSSTMTQKHTEDKTDEPDDEHYAETHDTSIWDEHPQNEQEFKEEQDEQSRKDRDTFYPSPVSPIKSSFVRKEEPDMKSLAEKNDNVDDILIGSLVERFFVRSNSTFEMDEGDVTFEDLEKFADRYRSSAPLHGTATANNRDKSNNRHLP